MRTFAGLTTIFSERDYPLADFVIQCAHSRLRSFAVPELRKAKGRIVIMNSAAAQLRIPCSSEYCTSKHALLRFAEFISIGMSLQPHSTYAPLS